MDEAFEILTGIVAILETMDEDSHDARYFVIIAALKRVLDMMP